MVSFLCLKKNKRKEIKSTKRSSILEDQRIGSTPEKSKSELIWKSQSDFLGCRPSDSKVGEKPVKRKISKWEQIRESLNKRMGPPWYQELSDSQIRACDRILEGLRDDLEQGTVFRCHSCLRDMGLKPFPSEKLLQRLIEISRGNDLAFLWFLNEVFYNTQCKCREGENYTVNERLILSSICHLDMITTLRELDKRLPFVFKKVKQRKLRIPQKPRTISYSPYLDTLEKPVITQSKKYPPPPVPCPDFSPYSSYRDPDYIVPNESNRWYQQQEVEPSDENTNDIDDKKNIVKSICTGDEDAKKKKAEIFESFKAQTICRSGELNADDATAGQIIHEIEMENASTQEFEILAKQYQNQLIVKTIVRDLIENAHYVKKIKPCNKHQNCIHDYELYSKLYEMKNNNNIAITNNEKPEKYFCFTKKGNKTESKPSFSFFYENIFKQETFDDIKKEISSNLAIEFDRSIPANEPIEICMQNLWQLELELWNEWQNNCPKKQEDDRDFFTSYDPNKKTDPIFLQLTLKTALERMRKNPKFVLASINRSYQHPLLNEWIQHRYGKRNTNEDRQNQILVSQQIFAEFKKHPIKMNLPTPATITKKKILNYNQRNSLNKKIRQTVTAYYHNLSQLLINSSRDFWPVMEPYHCTNGPPREAFYAYLPSSENDVFPFRPWMYSDSTREK